jgi:hypothetical protein
MVDFTAEDIRRIAREEIRRFVDAGLMYTESSVNAPKAKDVIVSEQALLNNFPEDIANVLVAEDKGGFWSLKATLFLGKEAFAKTVAVVKQLGGKYVSSGKNSHFEVPK